MKTYIHAKSISEVAQFLLGYEVENAKLSFSPRKNFIEYQFLAGSLISNLGHTDERSDLEDNPLRY